MGQGLHLEGVAGLCRFAEGFAVHLEDKGAVGTNSFGLGVFRSAMYPLGIAVMLCVI